MARDVKQANEHVDRDYPLQPVPKHARVGIISISAVLLGFTFFSPTMFAGANIGAAFSFWPDFIYVLLAGSLILGLYVALMSVVGSDTGLTTVLLSRYTLGKGGAKWADLLLGGTQVGWYGVTAAAMAELFAQALGWQEYMIPLIIFWSLLMGLTAYFGYKGMETLSYIAVPSVLILGIWVTFKSVGHAGGWAAVAALEPVKNMSVATALTIIVGTFASGGTQAPNWTRFSKSAKVAFWSSIIAFLLGNGLMLFFGAIGALTYQQPDFVKVLYEMGLIFWGIVLLIFNLWTTNDNAAYAFGVAGAEFFGVNNKKPFVVGGVIIATILAVTGIYNFLINYLVMLGIFIPPLGGVILGDYFFVWKKNLPALDQVTFPAFRWSAITSYLMGTLAAYLGNKYGIGIAPLNGIIIAAICLPFIEKIFARFNASQLAEMTAGNN